MTIVLTGGTGLVGRALGQRLSSENYKIRLLARSKPKNIPYPCQLFLWPDFQSLPPAEAFPIKGDYGVIHLAGEPISQWPWTSHLKNKIYDSRVKGAQKLVQTLHKLSHPPSFFFSAGAVGIYGEQGEKRITENDSLPPPRLFLQKVCKNWEAEALKANEFCRTVVFRLGLVMAYEKGFFI